MSYRSRALTSRSSNRDREIYIRMNPLSTMESPFILRPKLHRSKWIVVRENLRMIPFLAQMTKADFNKQSRDVCSIIYTRRQIRRKKEQIRELEQRRNFIPVRHFHIRTDQRHVEHYNISNVSPTSVLYHPSFDEEPVILQALLAYFNEQCDGTAQSIFGPFLMEICSVIKRDRKRRKRVDKLRRIALILSVFVFIILAFMLISLVISLLNTRWEFHKLYDHDIHGGIGWEPTVDSL